MGGRGTGISNERERLHRINSIWEMKVENQSWNKEKLIAEFQIRYGIARRTAMDYLKLLEKTDRIRW